MKLTTTTLFLALVATAFILPTAAASLPYACSDRVNPSCGGDVCYAASATQAPKCEDAPVVHVAKVGYCIEGKSPCQTGMLVCVTSDGRAVACAPDPCATANCFSSNACNPCGIPAGSCNAVTSAACPGIVCFWVSQQVPFCVHDPCASLCAIEAPPTVTCVEVVSPGPVAAGCWVDGKAIGPVATCETCMPAFYEQCRESTDGSFGCEFH